MRQRYREVINLLLVVVLVLITITIAMDARSQDHHCQGNACNDGGGDTLATADSILDTVVKTDSLGIGVAFSYGMGDVIELENGNLRVVYYTSDNQQFPWIETCILQRNK